MRFRKGSMRSFFAISSTRASMFASLRSLSGEAMLSATVIDV